MEVDSVFLVEEKDEEVFQIYFEKEDCFRLLGDVSPVVRTLAQKQFDDYVKRVRVFGHPRLAESLSDPQVIGKLLNEAVDRTE